MPHLFRKIENFTYGLLFPLQCWELSLSRTVHDGGRLKVWVSYIHIWITHCKNLQIIDDMFLWQMCVDIKAQRRTRFLWLDGKSSWAGDWRHSEVARLSFAGDSQKEKKNPTDHFNWRACVGWNVWMSLCGHLVREWKFKRCLRASVINSNITITKCPIQSNFASTQRIVICQ